MLNTTNQSINLPDALIEKCFEPKFSRDRSFYFYGDFFIETKWRGCEFFMKII
jgi:hypothetical protein